MLSRGRRGSDGERQRLACLRILARHAAVGIWSGNRAQLCLSPTQNIGGSPIQKMPSKLVADLASLGLVHDNGETVTLSSAGRAWLRRQLAGDDPFLEQHRDTHLRTVPGNRGTDPGAGQGIGRGSREKVLINDAESPLAWLRRRKDHKGAAMLDEYQFDAGERLRRDYTFAALGPRVTADWSGTGAARQSRSGSPACNQRDDVMAAKERVHRAISAAGPELGRMLFDVCCLLKGIEAAETAQGLPQRSGKVVLQLALTALARHYGLLATPQRTRHKSSTLHWGAWDFRPSI